MMKFIKNHVTGISILFIFFISIFLVGNEPISLQLKAGFLSGFAFCMVLVFSFEIINFFSKTRT